MLHNLNFNLHLQKTNYIMNKLKTVLLFTLVSVSMQSQRYRDSNRIGIGGGVSYLTVASSDLRTDSKLGWTAGFHTRGNFYNNWQMSFGMAFTQNYLATGIISTSNLKQVDYTMNAVQIYLLPGYVINKNSFNLEFGPVLQVNGKLAYDKDLADKYLVDQPLLTVKQMADVTNINANIYAGINVGVTNFRLRLGYQQGVTNFFGKVAKGSTIPAVFNDKLSGRIGMVTAVATIYL
jgi:Outer membrane protein beta-barrel domain